MTLVKHGEIHIDLDGRGALVIRTPDGRTATANSADDARRIAERWFKVDAHRRGQGMGKIVWHNGANFWKGKRGSEEQRPAGDARLTHGRALGQDLPLLVGVESVNADARIGGMGLGPRLLPIRFVRLAYQRVDSALERLLVVSEPVSSIEIDDKWVTLQHAGNGSRHKTLRTTDVLGDISRIDVKEEPW